MKRRIDKRLTDRARALRNEPTPQERAIWRLLSRYRPKFTRQLSIPPRCVADLACREARLIVEIDGSQHLESKQDGDRTRFLQDEGWTVIRFWNSEVDENPEGVAEAILLKAAECLGGTHPHEQARPVPRTGLRTSGGRSHLLILPSREGRPRQRRFP